MHHVLIQHMKDSAKPSKGSALLINPSTSFREGVVSRELAGKCLGRFVDG